jgi:hypothetical protein
MKHNIEQTLKLLHEPGSVFEVRIPKAGRHGTVAGWFDAPEKAAADSRWDGKFNIYVTLNPVKPALLARAANRLKERADKLTQDADVVCRRWLLVDCDPVRPAGISSNNEEKEAARKRGREVWRWLSERGWPAPVAADSGNGFHLLFRVDLPNDDKNRDLVKSCLEALAARFNDESVTVDTSVFNAARIVKLYGTMSAKGDNTKERPHRRSGVLKVPDVIEPVSVDKLTDLAVLAPKPQTEARTTTRTGGRFDLREWMYRHGLEVIYQKPWQNGGQINVLAVCPFNPDHGRDSSIIEHPSGALSFQCFHNGCAGNNWHALRDLLEPGWRDRNPGNRDKPRKNGEAADNTPERFIELVMLSAVERKQTRYLVYPYLPRGEITLLDGDMGAGKTWIWCAMVANLTGSVIQSLPWPAPKNAKALILTAEDDFSKTIRVRLEDMGASLNHVALVKVDGQEGGVMASDLEFVKPFIEAFTPDLILIDPITQYLTHDPNFDTNKATHVRKGLRPLQELARKLDCAVLLCRHLGKSHREALHRGIGSVDFAAIARSIITIGKDKATGQLVMAHTKANLSQKAPSYTFSLGDGRVEWGGVIDVQADELTDGQAGQERSTRKEAEVFLQEILADNPVKSKEVLRQAKEAGIKEWTIRRAAKNLQVVFQKEEGKFDGDWLWSLPSSGKEVCYRDWDVQTSVKKHPVSLERDDISRSLQGGANIEVCRSLQGVQSSVEPAPETNFAGVQTSKFAGENVSKQTANFAEKNKAKNTAEPAPETKFANKDVLQPTDELDAAITEMVEEAMKKNGYR